MSLTRRGFIKGLAALAVAPAPAPVDPKAIYLELLKGVSLGPTYYGGRWEAGYVTKVMMSSMYGKFGMHNILYADTDGIVTTCDIRSAYPKEITDGRSREDVFPHGAKNRDSVVQSLHGAEASGERPQGRLGQRQSTLLAWAARRRGERTQASDKG